MPYNAGKPLEQLVSLVEGSVLRAFQLLPLGEGGVLGAGADRDLAGPVHHLGRQHAGGEPSTREILSVLPIMWGSPRSAYRKEIGLCVGQRLEGRLGRV